MATPFFNAAYYLQNNKDVYESGMDAYVHYMQFGASEALMGATGRKPAPWFDVDYYFNNNPDLVAANLSAAQLFEHFANYGFKEGRAPSAESAKIVNANSLLTYALANPDLQAAFGIAADATELTQDQFDAVSAQYYSYGYNEARPGVPTPDVEDGSYKLTVGKDDITLYGDNQTAFADVEQNFLGAVTNTLETGDVITGAAGTTGHTLKANLALGVTGTQTIAPAISATTNNIDKVVLRAQTGPTDAGLAAQGNRSHIDAEKFAGVKEWWSDNSRATIQIEDVRTKPADTTIGLRDADPFVGFKVYFDPAQLENGTNLSNSALTLTLADTNNPGSLQDVPVDGVVFKLDGTSYTIQSEAMGQAADYAQFMTALEAALAEVEGLAGVTATLTATNEIVLVDPNGKTFETGSWKFINDEVPAIGTITYSQVVGAPDVSEELIRTNVVLDNVGRTSQGGTVDIGSLGDGGVQQFDVKVGADSWVTALKSQNYLGATTPNITVEQFLEVVNVDHLAGATGNITIGNTEFTSTGIVTDPFVAKPSIDNRVVDGLTDVRELNAAGFTGNVKAGITLTDDVIGRYLDDATEVVNFNYNTGSGEDNLTLNVASALTTDADFALNVDLGANDDRLNLDLNGGKSNQVTVNGGEGYNTIEVTSSHGTDASTTFKEFANFQKYVVAGDAGATGTAHNFTTMAGVKEVVVATIPVAAGPTATNTTLTNLEAETSVTLSGKNQTLGNNSNSAQSIGKIDINNAAAPALGVKLDNTARINGVLTVAELNIDAPATVYANTTVRTLDLESAGQRTTANQVTDINAQYVNTFNITGTQSLVTTINAAANSTGTATDRGNFVVNASTLGSVEKPATVDVTLSAAVVTAIDGTADRTNTFTGAEGAGDVLRFEGASAIGVTEATTISGFETINFGVLAAIKGGSFNAAKVSGVDQYNIVANDTANLALVNLADKVNVNVTTADVDFGGFSAAPGSENANSLTLRGEGSEINVSLIGGLATDVGTWNTAGVVSLNVGGYKTVNLNLKNSGTADDATDKQAYDFKLFMADSNGNIRLQADGATLNADYGTAGNTIAARDLVLTGGRAATKNSSDSDTVQLQNLDNSLKTIDLTGYAGQVSGSMVTPFAADSVTNVEVLVGAWNMGWDVKASATADNVTYNTTFRFTEASKFGGAADDYSTWTIDKFIASDAVALTAATQNNYSILDVSGLGITQYSDLAVVEVGTDLAIVSRDEFIANGSDATFAANNYTWKIELTGVANAADLGVAENFIFA